MTSSAAQPVDPTYSCGDISRGIRAETPAYRTTRSIFHSALSDLVVALGALYKTGGGPPTAEATMGVLVAAAPAVLGKYLAYQYSASRIGFYATMFNLQDCLNRDWNAAPNLTTPTPTGAGSGSGPAQPGAFNQPMGIPGDPGDVSAGAAGGPSSKCLTIQIEYNNPMSHETHVYCD